VYICSCANTKCANNIISKKMPVLKVLDSVCACAGSVCVWYQFTLISVKRSQTQKGLAKDRLKISRLHLWIITTTLFTEKRNSETKKISLNVIRDMYFREGCFTNFQSVISFDPWRKQSAVYFSNITIFTFSQLKKIKNLKVQYNVINNFYGFKKIYEFNSINIKKYIFSLSLSLSLSLFLYLSIYLSLA